VAELIEPEEEAPDIAELEGVEVSQATSSTP
jgi:hypothetical protein